MSKTFGKIEIAVAGVTFNNRQNKLWHLYKYDKGAYLTLRREKNNAHDANAVAVIAHTPLTNTHFCIGYLPANISCWVAAAIDEGRMLRCYRIKVDNKNQPLVVGVGRKGNNLGCHFNLVYEIPQQQVAVAYTTN